jgi:acetylornithine deacetylase/succinyl-diaminopimelate desuccinylase-like protein
MADHRTTALHYAHNHQSQFLDELKEFVSIPSISADPTRKADIQTAAEWVARQLRLLGMFSVQVFSTSGHPIVYGESLNAGSNAKTLLVYGHYDVQPPDPLDLWRSSPFQADQRDDNLFARGVSDMKGQVMATLKAIESIVRTGELPINFKFLFEGEEEIGSRNLEPFIGEHRDLLTCDFALNPDTGMIGVDKPTITYGLRGLAYFEIRVYGPDHDLHSGMYGGVVHNPAQALCELIAGMHDSQGKVTLPGFYDLVRPLDAEESSELSRLPMDEGFYLAHTGAPALWGEQGFSPVERAGARPTLEVNGLYSGFIGEGPKTVLPSWAMAKISTRLVPDQDPDEVRQQLMRYLKSNAPSTIRYDVTQMAGSPASISDRSSPDLKAMENAMWEVWNEPTLYRREGGSVPVVGMFQQHLGIDTINIGFSLPDDNAHSPNEKLHLPTFYRGIDTLVHFFFNLEKKQIR